MISIRTYKTTGVSIWATSAFNFYSIKPIIDKLKTADVSIHIYTVSQHPELIAKYLNIPRENIINIKALNKKYPIRSTVARITHKLFEKYMVSPDFSVMYSRIRSAKKSEGVFWAQKDGKWINSTYKKLFSLWMPNIFNGDTVLVLSLVTNPYWLCSCKNDVTLLMESWDHPVKMPLMHFPSLVYTWNDALAKDFCNYQGYDSSTVISPLKFRYIEEFSNHAGNISDYMPQSSKYLKDIEFITKQSYILYICTSSSRNTKAYNGEMKLINDLIKYCKKLNLWLYIKPKPDGLDTEYDSLKSEKKVWIGIYGTGSEGLDMLDDEYHAYRYLLLKQAQYVVNVGTTFVLEAALVGAKIVQLNILDNANYYGFSNMMSNPHIQKYLNSSDFVIDCKSSSLTVNNALLNQDTENISQCYSVELKKWLTNGHNVNSTVEKIISTIT